MLIYYEMFISLVDMQSPTSSKFVLTHVSKKSSPQTIAGGFGLWLEIGYL